MEKLQAALGEARKQRERDQKRAEQADLLPASVTDSQPLTEPTPPLREQPIEYGLDDRWSQLRAFTPDPDVLVRNRVVSRQASEDASAFDVLRTKILLQMRQNNWKRLAITSPLAQCGKSTTACNLALGLGRQKGIRSILFDMDLRNPSLRNLMGVVPPQSIGSLLEKSVPFAEQGLRFRDNVALSLASGTEQDPTRLLLADQTAEVLDEIQEEYQPDVMIFDMPAVLVNDDTRAFLKNVDCALIIARADQTKYAQFDAAEREVAEHTNVLGVVLNACRHAAGANAYDYSET